MTLTISISTGAESRLLGLAAAAGRSPAEFVARLVEQVVRTPGVDDALVPFRRQVAESGMTDEQLDAFLEGLRDEVWNERAAKEPKGRAA